jgi:DNA repair protein REV1
MGSRLEQKSNLVRKRIEGHTFTNEEGEEYEGSKFGGFSDYFRRKKIKLQNLDSELRARSDKPQIFKGVVCHVNGYTQPSLNDLHGMIVQHGGGFLQYLDGKTMVTHIVASNLTPKKKEEFRKYRIVKPAWIVDSVNVGKLLPWDAYRVVDEGVGQKVLGFDNGSIVSQMNKTVHGYREQTDSSWYTNQFKPQTPNQPPTFTQTVTPHVDIEEDEYPMEITSSMENALESVETTEHRAAPEEPSHQIRATPREDQTHVASRELLEVRTELETPPSSSPHEPQEAAGRNKEQAAAPLRAREWSQEADYSMAVVRNSEVLKNVPPEQ